MAQGATLLVQLMKALLDKQAQNDILTSNQREVAMLEHLGVSWPELTADQQGVLISLIEELARVMPAELQLRESKRFVALASIT